MGYALKDIVSFAKNIGYTNNGYYMGRPISDSARIGYKPNHLSISTPSGVDHGVHDKIASMYFKKGGRVKKTGMALVHKGEFVLPVGVKPTKAQLKKVAKKKSK